LVNAVADEHGMVVGELRQRALDAFMWGTKER
jgi:hypothetical protein